MGSGLPDTLPTVGSGDTPTVATPNTAGFGHTQHMQKITPTAASPLMTVIAVDSRDQVPHPLIAELVRPVLAHLEQNHQIEWLLPAATPQAVADAHAHASSTDDRIIWVGFNQGIALVDDYTAANSALWAAVVPVRFEHRGITVATVAARARACYRRTVAVLT